MWGDILTVTEHTHGQSILADLADVGWAQPLIRKLNQAGGLKAKNKDLLFELRFAGELHRRGLTAEYEHPGSGVKTIDFKILAQTQWLIELVRIGVSEAARGARRGGEDCWTMTLSSDAEDPRQSEEGEILLAQQKVAAKAEKFPAVTGGARHIILVDMQGFLGGNSGDRYDCHGICYGNYGLDRWYRRYWRNGAIVGLFDKENPLAAASLLRERVHFVGFKGIIEEERAEKESEEKLLGCLFANPHLFANKDAAVSAGSEAQLMGST